MRTCVYVDGFNLYYGALSNGPHKWLDLERYFRILRRDEDLIQIHYFTALISGPTRPNQDAYLRALSTTASVRVTLGKFKRRSIACRVGGCAHVGGRVFESLAEKRTDVNIALQMLADAYEDRCDTFVVVSGDSDLVPAVDRIRQTFPRKRVIVYVPTRNAERGAAVELRAAANKNRELPLNLLKRAQFPARIPDGSGGWIEKPAGW